MQIEVAVRFCGPKISGNGGYTCGLIAETLADGACQPPLDRSLRLTSVNENDYVISDASNQIAAAHCAPREPLTSPPGANQLQRAQSA